MTAMLLGLNFSINIIYTILVSIPISLLFISLGILIGTITTEKSSSGVSSIVVQLVAFTSGMYFSTDMVGNAIDQTYFGNGALEYDLVKAGFVPQATMYMYAMYYIFLNFGPLFYTSELTELFNDCPWFGTNASWTPKKTNTILGGLFHLEFDYCFVRIITLSI